MPPRGRDEADGSSDLGPDDIAAFERAAKQLRLDPSVVKTPQLKFFEEYMTSLGWTGEVPAFAKPPGPPPGLPPGPPPGLPPGAPAAVESVEGEAAAAPPDAAATASAVEGGVTELADSDDDAPKKPQRPKECTFGADLEAELRKEKNISLDEEDTDPERLKRESDPYPLLPETEEQESSDAMKKRLGKFKQEAQAALEQGNLLKALEGYTKVIRIGGASPLMLATRASLLLKLKRPLAAVRDCSVALKINPNLIKAYRIRGISHRRLGHWRRSHRDFSQAQKLDFDDSTATIHKFVASKLGLVQDPRTGAWSKRDSSKAFEQTAAGAELKAGQAVRIQGLQKAAHLNGMRGVVQKLDAASAGRWQVELRLEEGKLEVKSIRADNIVLVQADEKQDWRDAEKRHAEARRIREAEEQRQREDEERRKRRAAVEKRLKQDGMPDMDPSELVEAELSGMQVEEKLCKRVRKHLEPDQALEILWQVQASRVNDMAALLLERVNQVLGEEEDDDYDDDMDPEKLFEEADPMPPLPDDFEAEPDEWAQRKIDRAKKNAAWYMDDGDTSNALVCYNEAIEWGGGSALLLAKRAELLLANRRPLAAIRDCSAALEVNPDCGKAFRIRGVAHRRLLHWREAHNDLAQGQTLDFDDATTSVQSFVAKRAKAQEEREAKRRKGVGLKRTSLD